MFCFWKVEGNKAGGVHMNQRSSGRREIFLKLLLYNSLKNKLY
ncbi:hypothetical protein D922_03798 [Enterococcus faecalis 06-MB-DW-09]|nr:hypothetical protein D922_03798 [Enterococcus faecalis 06-MB-DW-09]